jgi:hypothetical protein
VVESANKIWKLTCIYGEQRREDKYKMWDKMRELNQNYSLLWMIIGDFNEILYSSDRDGETLGQKGIWILYMIL